jgi:hypothetical protein
MHNCQKLARERLIKFQAQGQKVKSNSHGFRENDLALFRVEARQKLEPLWKGPFEIQSIRGSNSIIQEVGKRKKTRGTHK